MRPSSWHLCRPGHANAILRQPAGLVTVCSEAPQTLCKLVVFQMLVNLRLCKIHPTLCSSHWPLLFQGTQRGGNQTVVSSCTFVKQSAMTALVNQISRSATSGLTAVAVSAVNLGLPNSAVNWARSICWSSAALSNGYYSRDNHPDAGDAASLAVTGRAQQRIWPNGLHASSPLSTTICVVAVAVVQQDPVRPTSWQLVDKQSMYEMFSTSPHHSVQWG